MRLCLGWGGIIKSFRAFAHDAATNEFFQRAQFVLVFGSDKTDGIPDGIGAASAANAMDVIFSVHREIIIHDVRDAVHVNAASGDVRGNEDTYHAGFEILQGAQPLVL